MTTVGKLDSFFTSIISDLMLIERQPLYRLEDQRDTISTRSSAYAEVDTKLNDLQDAVRALTSTGLDSALTSGRTSTVSNVASGYTVLSASVSAAAIVGTYDVAVTELAREHRVRSDQQTYADQALGLSGTILLGGASSRSVSTTSTIPNTVTAFGTAAPGSTWPEIGSDTYYVETRQDASAGWQFRVVDADGVAVSVLDSSGTDYTAEWQAISAGATFDTGRGLTITFGSDSGLYQAASRGSGAAQLDYTAQGANVTIDATDTLNAIASKINDASFASGNGVSATIVDRQLVLAAESTGTGHSVVAADSSGTVLQSLGVLTGTGTFKNEMQTALDASFTVNGLSVTRSKNTGLTDVITGITLNLEPDAKNQSATLAVDEDWTTTTDTVDDFVEKFNAILDYLDSQTAVTETSGGDMPVYSRGPLAGENIFNDLRGGLLSIFMSQYSPGGQYTSLREVGLTLDDNLRASVSDRNALEMALTDHYDDLVSLLDTVMGSFDTTLGRFTGDTSSEGYLDATIANYSDQIQGIDEKIEDMNAYLVEREDYLTNQYAEMQAVLLNMSYAQQLWSGIYGSVNRLV